jgi:hypothetical protein
MYKEPLDVMAVACSETNDRLLQQSTIVAPAQPILFEIQPELAILHAQVASHNQLPTIDPGVNGR